MTGFVSEVEIDVSNGEVCCIYLFDYLLFIVLFIPLQGSITDDKSKATHHIYPSPSQQEEGRVESVSIKIQSISNWIGIKNL